MEKEHTKSPSSKRLTYGIFAGVCLLGLAIGLGVGLSGGSSSSNSVTSNESDGQNSDNNNDNMSKPTLSRLRSYSTSMMSGYSACSDFVRDLEEASRVMTDVYVDRMALQYYHGQYFYGVPRGGVVMPRGGGDMVTASGTATGNKGSSGSSSTGETDYGTNNQVEGVDEADVVKSDGDYVYAAYGDTVVVWNARSGREVSRTVLPADDDEGTAVCQDEEKRDEEDPCYETSPWGRVQVASLLLHQNRLAVVVQSPEYAPPIVVPFEKEEDPEKPSPSPEKPTLYGYRTTRIFVYDTSTVGDGASDNTPLTLVKRKDLQGYYKSARSLDRHAHVVTSSGVNLYDSVYRDLEPIHFVPKNRLRRRRLVIDVPEPFLWQDFDPKDLKEEDYRQAAQAHVATKIPDFAHRLAHDVLGTDNPTEEQCQRMVRLALFAKPYQEDADTATTRTVPFTQNHVLSNFAQVTSFDLLDDDDFDTSGTATTSTERRQLMTTHSSGMFVPLNSYSSSIYASSTTLIIAGEAYEEDEDGNWIEKTLLFSFKLHQATSTPQTIGEVPGSLLNQFSMDHITTDTNEDYLRVATTTWARWAEVDDEWTQTEESTSQVTVLKLTANDDTTTATMPIVGQVEDLGRGERIYAVRFLGERGFVVTFRQIDPFYTLDLSDPTKPVVMGELKIPGFSNYLHPIDGPDSDLILAVGQDADVETGRTKGLQIALYDVSDMTNPRQVKQYTEGGSDSSSYSSAQYDHRAFRYLDQTEVLVLPLMTYGKNDFDGFVVYDLYPRDLGKRMEKRLEISHKREPFGGVSSSNGVAISYCWSYNHLTSRSMVFDGNVMTMKGHTVLSHDLDNASEEELWMLNLDAKKPDNKNDCRGWW